MDEMYSRLIALASCERAGTTWSPSTRSPGVARRMKRFDYARSERRAVVTENVRDYRPLAEALLAAGESHSGLVFTTETRWPRTDPGSLITGIDAMLASTPGEPVDAEIWL